MECEFPTINANNEAIKSILSEVKTIAVLGLSPNVSKDSYRVAQYLQAAGYKIIPVSSLNRGAKEKGVSTIIPLIRSLA